MNTIMRSYAEYFSKLRCYERGYRVSDPDLADAFETVIDLVKDFICRSCI